MAAQEEEEAAAVAVAERQLWALGAGGVQEEEVRLAAQPGVPILHEQKCPERLWPSSVCGLPADH